MAKWLTIISILLLQLATPTNHEELPVCKFHLSFLQGQQMTCSNANMNFFHVFDTPLNRTHWFRCHNCSLDVLDETTFNFPKRNNISVVDFPNCRVRVLRKHAFAKFFLLKILILHNNSIQMLETMCFMGVKRLIHLDLSTNYIKILTNNLFLDLENLDILNLSYNQIVFINSEAFYGLSNLKYLYLNYNQLDKLEENTFKHLINLKILYLEHNRIHTIHQNAFNNLLNLHFLYISHNSISYLVQYNFKQLTSLVDLQLSFNNLTEVQTSSFNGLKNLRSLHLGNNFLKTVKPYGFIGLDKIEILDLINNRFETIYFFDYFGHMENLRYLWLNKNTINNINFDYKYQVQNLLTILDVSDNNLTSFNFKSLFKNLPNVKEIVVANNSWECDFLLNMYKFFEETNVTICSNNNCDKVSLENVCVDETNDVDVTEVDVDDFPADFSTNKGIPFNNNGILYFITAVLLEYI